ncbi:MULTISPECIES: hypothetical protein [unclassified Acinetobacter]|uniref:hypothetical protein n=1 Tax=unclassified Acinetobacter TaxID=196816 RepID=UPI0035BB67E1
MEKSLFLVGTLLLANTAFAQAPVVNFGKPAVEISITSSVANTPAATTNVNNNVNAPKVNPPTFAIGAFENINGKLNSLNTNVAVKSNSTHRICWTINNTGYHGQTKLEEIINAPARSQFVDPDSTHVERSNDGRYHRIERLVYLSPEQDAISKCWKFDNTDPSGEYNIQLKVGDIVFPAQRFSLR